jgi:hypothetical protein
MLALAVGKGALVENVLDIDKSKNAGQVYGVSNFRVWWKR